MSNKATRGVMSPAELSLGTGNELNWPGFTSYWLQNLLRVSAPIFCLGFSSLVLRVTLLEAPGQPVLLPLSPFPAPSHTLALPSTCTAG